MTLTNTKRNELADFYFSKTDGGVTEEQAKVAASEFQTLYEDLKKIIQEIQHLKKLLQCIKVQLGVL